ncbi:preprotein translocase subunit SecE [Arenimonas fontis]|uniref:Protein translocase subunit SecE n=1 Tax=Arenimonas fontis TaxID=2608255 RepID=A0A5B2Z865_9GAMM|nr:preprotein translocase subunit SecE [Arenimonas fontis]KAA2283460.1 preprotein translocase subunit SecE [Arenimonas fontis]
MNTKVEQNQVTASPADLAKYVLAAALVAAGLFVFYWFGQWPGLLRGLVVAAGVAAAAGVMALTARGRQAREFLSESVFELRKVVWPTREEATRTTGVILIVVVIVSLILAGFDLVISWLIRLLLGN